jgi:hypothetical protein
MTLRYTSTPYGLPIKESDNKLPSHARPIDTAPIGAKPIIVWEPDGQSFRAIHHLGRWMQVETILDHYSGRNRTACNGEIVNNPVAWSPSS